MHAAARHYLNHLAGRVPCVGATTLAESAGDILFHYVVWRARCVPPRPRIVRYESSWFGAYDTPVAAAVEAGDNLEKFLSRQFKTYGYVSARQNLKNQQKAIDHALNAYGVHHLSISNNGKRDTLAFIHFTRTHAIFVQCGDHSTWDGSKSDLQDAVAHADYMKANRLNGVVGVSRTHTPRERQKLAWEKVNTAAATESGIVVTSMISTSGHAARYRIHADNILDVLELDEAHTWMRDGWLPYSDYTELAFRKGHETIIVVPPLL